MISKQQGQSPTQKEQEEIEKAIQLSLMETQSHSKNGIIAIDDKSDPAPTKSDLNAPVGMINVGSSCWYNSVIQVFYHLPAIRRMILSNEYENVVISEEFTAIRNTFTLLKGSMKSWIDTKKYVQVFKSHMPSGSTQQVCSNHFYCCPSKANFTGCLRVCR